VAISITTVTRLLVENSTILNIDTPNIF